MSGECRSEPRAFLESPSSDDGGLKSGGGSARQINKPGQQLIGQTKAFPHGNEFNIVKFQAGQQLIGQTKAFRFYTW